MRHMAIYKLSILAALLLSAALNAATPYEDEVPIELARYFLPGNWYADLPPGLPAFTIPEGLELVGSQDQTQRKQGLFRTSMDTREAGEMLALAILGNSGWMRLEDISRTARGGFVPANNNDPLPGARLCHDNVGMLTITSRAEEFVRLVFNSSAFFNNQPCSQRSQMEALSLRNRSGFENYVPLLELPEDIRPVTPQRIVDEMSGRPFVYNTEARLTADTSLRRLANSFARQMRRQGWRRNAAWRGDVTAGNNWTRETPEGTRLGASIDIVRMADNNYAVKLQVAELAQEEQQ